MTTVTKTQEYNDEDFPVLGATVPVKTKVKPEVKPEVKTKSSGSARKKRFTKGIKISYQDLGFISRMDTLKANRHQGRSSGRPQQEDGKRAAAYEQLQDKEAMAKRLTKTRLCWSVQKGIPCPHGAGNCHFAHTKDELRMAPCLFGDRCRFVRWRGSEYCNNSSSDRKCHYVHPEESRENYMKRTGLDKIELKVPDKAKTKVTDIVPVQVLTKPTGEPHPRRWAAPRRKIDLEEEKEERIKKNSEYIELLNEKNPCTLLETCSDDEDGLDKQLDELLESTTEYATYTVPKAIAIDTLKAALEAGQTKITLTIV